MADLDASHLSLEVQTVKILILGDQTVGKTSLLLRYTRNEFVENQISTLGVDFKQKEINREGNTFYVQIWDSAGQERFRSVTKTYYKKASGIIVAYDSTNYNSFLSVRTWVQQIVNEVGTSVPVVLAATKCDLAHQNVNINEVKELCKELGFKAFSTSSKTGLHVNELFDYTVDEVLKTTKMSDRTMSLALSKEAKLGRKKRCC